MNKKNTKKALLMSALSLLACVSMLIGSTFAWFTDSVSSANNIIKSGNLDIALEYLNAAGEWESIQDKSDILDKEALYEPGYVQVAYLKLENKGSLALKYNLGINIVNEIAGINQAGDAFNLSDYIYFGVAEVEPDAEGNLPVFDRATAVAAVDGDAQWIKAGYSAADSLLANSAPVYMALVVYMPEDIGNVANHDGEHAPTIELGINVFATQYTYEADSFDNQYDADAVYANAYAADAAGLAAALENAEDGDIIALTEDIVLGNPMTRSNNAWEKFVVAKGKNITLNLNGNNITLVDTAADKNNDGKFTSADNAALFQVKGNLTVIGEGTLSMQHSGDNMGWNALTAVFSVEGGVLTLGEGVNVVHKGGSDMAYAVDVNTTVGETVLNVDGATLYSSYVGARIFNNNKTQKGIVNFNSGVISGGSRDVWAQQANGNCPVANAVVNTTIPYTTNEGGDRYFFGGAAAAIDQASLKAALTDGADKVDMLGNTVNLNYGLSKDLIPAGSTVTISNAVVSGKSYGNAADGTVIFENCTFTNTGAYSIHFDAGNGDVVFKNCELYGWNSFGAALNSVSFYDCSLYGNGTYALIRSYADLHVENCYIDTTNANHNDNYSEGVEAISGATLTEKNNTYVATTLAEVMSLAKKGNTTIDAKGANLGDYNYNGTFANGTVLKNAKFTYVYGASIDGVATFENCEFVSDHSYSANFSDGSYTGKAIFNNCLFDGWSSFGDAITAVEMNNCTFEWNNPYSMLRFYQNAVLTDCNFIAIDGIDTNKTGTVVELINCTGIEGKIYNNGSNVGTWIVDGVDISSTVTSW